MRSVTSLFAVLMLACGSSAGDTPQSSGTVVVSPPSVGSTNAPFEEPIGSADDVDMDGIATAADRCPENPEDMDGFQDVDGCPEIDNDGDSVLDVDDQCPNEPESRDGIADADGCPDVRVFPAPVS